ncbi:MAG: N-acetyltransferase [Lentilactobacillus diolivorans]|jgi:RimJ/RimL family protein N-acetyltransferase|nr:N-acetyltransferase [Lentilactobacillus diolivorans]RRG01003.1 MAG: N-acetyltransferase [Lactobacillus sp.]
MNDIYERCPTFFSQNYQFRQTQTSDALDLLKVYDDPASVPLFNSDNCGGDDFHYPSSERMLAAIKYWQEEYVAHGFVRWSIIDLKNNLGIGTVEVFDRKADDFFDNTAILRLDLRSDYENTPVIKELIEVYKKEINHFFNSNQMATKAINIARTRITALQAAGFVQSTAPLIGHDGTAYVDYFVYKFN